MNFSPYFTLARQIYACGLMGVLCGFSTYVQARPVEKFDADACQNIFQLSASHAQLHSDELTQWWFSPHPTTVAAASQIMPSSLELNFADSEQVLGTSSDSVLIRWRSKSMDALDWASTQPYLIVRTESPIRDMDGKIIGSFSRLIAKARWDTRFQVEQTHATGSEQSLVAPLRISGAVHEIDKTDRVIPRVCLSPRAFVSHEPLPEASNFATQAQILGLANTRTMGSKRDLAIINKGRAQGVNPNQTWFLIDAVRFKKPIDANVSVTRTRGQVELLQIFEHYSLVRLAQGQREVMRGTYLKRAIPNMPSTPDTPTEPTE